MFVKTEVSVYPLNVGGFRQTFLWKGKGAFIFKHGGYSAKAGLAGLAALLVTTTKKEKETKAKMLSPLPFKFGCTMKKACSQSAYK